MHLFISMNSNYGRAKIYIFFVNFKMKPLKHQETMQNKSDPNFWQDLRPNTLTMHFLFNASNACKNVHICCLFFQIWCKWFLNLNKNTICKWKINKSTSKGYRKLVVMLKILLQCLFKNLNPKLTYESRSSNEHRSKENTKTKWNQYRTLLYLIIPIGCTSQL